MLPEDNTVHLIDQFVDLVYNLKRIMNIVSFKDLTGSFKKALEALLSGIFSLLKLYDAVIMEILSSNMYVRIKAKNQRSLQKILFHSLKAENFGYFWDKLTFGNIRKNDYF
jgi:hypothetical protein